MSRNAPLLYYNHTLIISHLIKELGAIPDDGHLAYIFDRYHRHYLVIHQNRPAIGISIGAIGWIDHPLTKILVFERGAAHILAHQLDYSFSIDRWIAATYPELSITKRRKAWLTSLADPDGPARELDFRLKVRLTAALKTFKPAARLADIEDNKIVLP